MLNKIMAHPFPVTIIGWNVIFAVIKGFLPEWADLLALHYPALARSVAGLIIVDFLRLLSYTFIHSGASHLAANMVFLLLFSLALQPPLSNRKILILYFGSGLTGGCFFLLGASIWDFPASPLTLYGASCAVLGLCSGTLILNPRKRFEIPLLRKIPMYLPAIAVLLIIGLWNPSKYALLAHLGGISGGLAIASIIKKPY